MKVMNLSVTKELLLHVLAVLVLLALLIAVKFFFLEPRFMGVLVLGALIGTFVPDIDHFIYVRYRKPHELTSQRVNQKFAGRQYREALGLLYATRAERQDLIFHTALFQCLFVVFSFLVVSSSGSLLGRGIVLGFLLHLSVDQYINLKQGNLSRWFMKFPFELSSLDQRRYFFAQLVLIGLLGIIF